MRSSLILSLLSAAAAPIFAAPTTDSSPSFSKKIRSADNDDIVPGRFIVQLKPGATPEDVESHHRDVRRMLRKRDGSQGTVERTFHVGDFDAYVGDFDDTTADEIAKRPDVLGVEHDVIIRVDPRESQDAAQAAESRDLTTQRNAAWHLGDISHTAAGASDYVYDDSAGQGQTVYVFDTGIRATHEDFEGRVRFGINGVTRSTTAPADGNADQEGHGTHVASTAAGRQYGVAKKANIVDVKVFEGAVGSASALLTGIEWAVNDIKARGIESTSLLSMSLTTGPGSASDRLIIAAYRDGILSVVAAGNGNNPASQQSPGFLPEVITVGMTEPDRSRLVRFNGAFGSAYGPELDIFAPGGDILAAGHLSNSAAVLKSGTSMATPAVSGLICYLRALEGGLASPEQARSRIVELSHKGVVSDVRGSPNRLAYNGSGR